MGTLLNAAGGHGPPRPEEGKDANHTRSPVIVDPNLQEGSMTLYIDVRRKVWKRGVLNTEMSVAGPCRRRQP